MNYIITLVIPVYNVEPYLRQCLDSVVNQTMQDIQIICVNDGSTDGSRTILQEYADHDTRIEIIDQENQGGGSARNAAYSCIRGKYVYFTDPDDWLELDLCEKTLKRIEETNADVVYFRYYQEYPGMLSEPSEKFNPNLPDVRITPEQRGDLFGNYDAPWLKIWKSDFLLHHQVRFSEGKRPHNDVFQNWKGCVLANRIAILDEPLYHYRHLRPGSYQATLNQKHFVIVETMNEFKTFLLETGKHDEYRDVFVLPKLKILHYVYHNLPEYLKPRFVTMIRDTLTADDHAFYRTNKLAKHLVQFYKIVIIGDPIAIMKYHIVKIMRTPEQTLRRWIIKPIKKRLKAA